MEMADIIESERREHKSTEDLEASLKSLHEIRTLKQLLEMNEPEPPKPISEEEMLRIQLKEELERLKIN